MTIGRIHLCALALAATALLATAAAASGGSPSKTAKVTKVSQPATVTTFATGLTNPRHVRLGPDGNLYVAEAGVGGTEPAVATPGCDLVDNMFSQDGPYKPGFTGRISRILPNGTRQTVAEGLPSVVDNFGETLGASDLAWVGGKMYVTLEGGGCSRGLPDHPAGIARVNADGSWEIVADVSAFVRANPVEVEPECGPEGDCEPDGVPHSLHAHGRYLYVVETNHNSVLRVDPTTGTISRMYDLSEQDPAPIVLARKGNTYYLGGFRGEIQTFGHKFGAIQTFDEGFGPIVELEFAKGRLHVLETFGADTPWTPETGQVIRRESDGARTTIADGLDFPIGMAQGPGGALYVSTKSFGQGEGVEGAGEIVRIDLR
jgi:hypothetical protein